MEPMLLDPVGGTSSRGSFTAQTPAELIYRDVVLSPMLRARKFEGGGDRTASATDNGYLNRLASLHGSLVKSKAKTASPIVPRVSMRYLPENSF
jgi:hypothetical protein